MHSGMLTPVNCTMIRPRTDALATREASSPAKRRTRTRSRGRNPNPKTVTGPEPLTVTLGCSFVA